MMSEVPRAPRETADVTLAKGLQRNKNFGWIEAL
jgi:hypothetical protein